jgi:protein subunit release factor A
MHGSRAKSHLKISSDSVARRDLIPALREIHRKRIHISDMKSVRIFRYAGGGGETINKTEDIRRIEDKTGAHKVSNGLGHN